MLVLVIGAISFSGGVLVGLVWAHYASGQDLREAWDRGYSKGYLDGRTIRIDTEA